MRIVENCGGGDTVILRRRDRLEKVPETHRNLITSVVFAAFQNPIDFFNKAAAKSPFQGMRHLLTALLTSAEWDLRLHTNGFDDPGIAAFGFPLPGFGDVEVAPAKPIPVRFSGPEAIAEFYSAVDWLHWTLYGGAGGLYRGVTHESLPIMPNGFSGHPIDPKQTNIWGSTGCGDWFIYTADGRAGMASHENGFVHLIGTIGDTIDWLCGELLAGRKPEFDYTWCRK